MPKVPMPEQDPQERVKNFNEVALGYTAEQAQEEAKRCMFCKKPKCIEGCPVEIDIPAFIEKIKEGDFQRSLEILWEKNRLPAICGRVCPQESQCEKTCILGKKPVRPKGGKSKAGRDEPVAIGRLERFVADWDIAQNSSRNFGSEQSTEYREQKIKKKTVNSQRPKVAVIGSGPGGLTAAADLAKAGYSVTIFESLHAPGGVLRYGIPEFRLPKEILDIEIKYIQQLGVKIEVNMVIGRIKNLRNLKEEGFLAFFIATGAGLPYFLGIEGENLNGVYSANEFLTRTNLMRAYEFPDYDTPIQVGKKVAVIGAGNVAMDSARAALRQGAKEVYIVYRRSEEEMPARLEEIEHARQEAIKFMLLTNPTRIFGDQKGWVKSMECIKNRLGEPDSSGRPRPVPIEGSEFILDFDTIVCAIGQGPNPLLLSAIPDLKLNKRGYIEVEQDGRTSIPGVFAGGDIVTGAATVIEAMGAGKCSARAIDNYLKEKGDGSIF